MRTEATEGTRPLFAQVPTALAGWLDSLSFSRRESKAKIVTKLLEMERDDPRLPPPGPPEPERPKRPRGRPRKGT